MVCVYMHGDRPKKHIKMVGEACHCHFCYRALMNALQRPQKVVLTSALTAWPMPQS